MHVLNNESSRDQFHRWKHKWSLHVAVYRVSNNSNCSSWRLYRQMHFGPLFVTCGVILRIVYGAKLSHLAEFEAQGQCWIFVDAYIHLRSRWDNGHINAYSLLTRCTWTCFSNLHYEILKSSNRKSKEFKH